MFGAFRPSTTNLGGLLWKSPWRMSKTRKMRTRTRLTGVDNVISTLESSGIQTHSLMKALALPTEEEMRPKDKYTIFSRTSPGYRKGMHKVPHWTRMTLRNNPEGF